MKKFRPCWSVSGRFLSKCRFQKGPKTVTHWTGCREGPSRCCNLNFNTFKVAMKNPLTLLLLLNFSTTYITIFFLSLLTRHSFQRFYILLYFLLTGLLFYLSKAHSGEPLESSGAAFLVENSFAERPQHCFWKDKLLKWFCWKIHAFIGSLKVDRWQQVKESVMTDGRAIKCPMPDLSWTGAVATVWALKCTFWMLWEQKMFSFFHLYGVGVNKICTSKYCSRGLIWVNWPFNSHQMRNRSSSEPIQSLHKVLRGVSWQLQVDAHPGFMPHLARSSLSDLSVGRAAFLLRTERLLTSPLTVCKHRLWVLSNCVIFRPGRW